MPLERSEKGMKFFMNYLIYMNEKYYRNGFVDGSQLVMGCFEK